MMDADVRIPDHVTREFVATRLDLDRIQRFRKTETTRAVRMPGAFSVETTEGALRCEDGWLAIDSRGEPYPIAAEEFAQIYEPACEVCHDTRLLLSYKGLHADLINCSACGDGTTICSTDLPSTADASLPPHRAPLRPVG